MQNDLINGRTPEEIKLALKVCNEDDCLPCPYEMGYICSDYMIRDALAYIEHLEAKQLRWISVKERLPRCGERVLVTNDGSVWEAYLSISHKWVRQEFVWAAKVTHWMPLPEPPKGE